MSERAVAVSVVMPVYNEEQEIEACVTSLLQQDYPRSDMEWIFVDGGSTDGTMERLQCYAAAHPSLIRLYDNPKKIVPCAMNIGIAQARGRYIVRMDAHARYAPDYIRRCVAYLEQGVAENVGGVMKTEASGTVGEAIAKMLSSPFGVGNAAFRIGGKSGYVDTVPFGAFRREVFSRYGGYDERLARNQDNEMNDRIRRNGGRVYLSEEIRLAYRCRDSVGGIVRMALQNGRWNIITARLCPGAMGWRHFVPLLFVLSIVGGALLGCFWPMFWWALALEMAVYAAADVVASCRAADNARQAVLLMGLFGAFHVAYGCGSLCGMGQVCARRYRRGGYQPPKLS